MVDERHDFEADFDTRDVKRECERHLYHHVILTTQDGRTFDGIIEAVDDDQLTVLVGEDVIDWDRDDRQFYGYGFPRPRPRFRRFRRQVLPLALLATLALLPYAVGLYPYF